MLSNKKVGYKYLLIILLVTGFLSCKRSVHQQTQREYDPKLISKLHKLEHKYATKKVRINTWDNKSNAYQDLQIVDEEDQKLQTLTIGDSVQFLSIDTSLSDGIRAKIKLQNKKTGYISYFNIEEFEPAAAIDPDLKDY